MSVKAPVKGKRVSSKVARTVCGRDVTIPPRNPNKRPTHISMERSIGRMKAEDRAIIRRAL